MSRCHFVIMSFYVVWYTKRWSKVSKSPELKRDNDKVTS